MIYNIYVHISGFQRDCLPLRICWHSYSKASQWRLWATRFYSLSHQQRCNDAQFRCSRCFREDYYGPVIWHQFATCHPRYELREAFGKQQPATRWTVWKACRAWKQIFIVSLSLRSKTALKPQALVLIIVAQTNIHRLTAPHYVFASTSCFDISTSAHRAGHEKAHLNRWFTKESCRSSLPTKKNI